MMEKWIIIAIIIFAGILAYLVKALTKSGALAAIIVGAAVMLGFGLNGLFLLGTFFVSSSLWSEYKSSVKKTIEEKLAKGATRDWRQVAANGGAAALFSLINFLQPNIIWLLAFAVSLASANSDTWASEIGSLSKKNPLFIRTFRPVERGTSGAISFLGTSAALAGALLIALLTLWLFHLHIFLAFLIFLFGFLGNLIDTLFGAFYQQLYKCSQCGIETERRIHCQKETLRIKGINYIDNDMVNFLSGLIAALLALGIVLLVV
ncbi:DUF92 domain-containing protein [Bacillus salipaludis]|uniref:DUF92 domain-containing protein n=1 Tax=Bacillus salipaludis TaxID=2547811 RepID=A0A4R5VSG8_9BACI|nr:DUF92 domain-containing protein [Bacillus salipaludis]MDQ6599653.1 DUF92 domain-containing protein [Bacillus salipaludis]TDK61718.1 DUF92 domain-containing protein [Bacillus salipaludis]